MHLVPWQDVEEGLRGSSTAQRNMFCSVCWRVSRCLLDCVLSACMHVSAASELRRFVWGRLLARWRTCAHMPCPMCPHMHVHGHGCVLCLQVALVAACHKWGLPVLAVAGAGAKADPTRLKVRASASAHRAGP